MPKLTDQFGVDSHQTFDKPVRNRDSRGTQDKKCKPKRQNKTSATKFSADDLEIKPLKTNKDKIKQPALAKLENNMLIPPVGSSVIFSGKSGCGKSTLLARLLIEPQFYKGYFDEIFIFSPTANSDDIQKQMKIPKENVFTDLEDAAQLLAVLQSAQKRLLEDAKANEVPQIAVIFDDVIGDKKLMNSTEFTKMFYQVRHLNCSTFLCAQHFKRVPLVCRNQANFIFFFAGSRREVEIIAEEYCPPGWRDKEFSQLVDWATRENYSFFTINMKIEPSFRFRKKLSMILPMNALKPVESEIEQSITCITSNHDAVSTQQPEGAAGELGGPETGGASDGTRSLECAEEQLWQRHSKRRDGSRGQTHSGQQAGHPTGPPAKRPKKHSGSVNGKQPGCR